MVLYFREIFTVREPHIFRAIKARPKIKEKKRENKKRRMRKSGGAEERRSVEREKGNGFSVVDVRNNVCQNSLILYKVYLIGKLTLDLRFPRILSVFSIDQERKYDLSSDTNRVTYFDTL